MANILLWLLLSSVWAHMPSGEFTPKLCGRNNPRVLAREAQIRESFKVKWDLREKEAVGIKHVQGEGLDVQFDISSLMYLNDKSVYSFLVKQLLPSLSRYLNRLLKLKVPLAQGVNPFYAECFESRFSKSFDFRGGLGILVTASNYGEVDPTYAAFSLTCKQDDKTGRPILGQLNYNPAEISINNFDTMFETTLHELFHILGFNSELFYYFIDENMNKRNNADSFVRSPSGKYIGVKTPAVLREAKSFYNCPTIESVPLEDEGGPGSAQSHWERSIFYDEFMTASSVSGSKISVFSLALLEDSGWYTPDYSMKEQFTYLKGTECDFSLDYSTECKYSFGQVCTLDYKSQGFCLYDPFNKGKLRATANSIGVCNQPRKAPHGKNRFFQYYGPKSACFQVALIQREHNPTSALFTLDGPACYEAICTRENDKSSVRLTLNNKYYYCNTDLEEINIEGRDFKGVITCPIISLFCNASTNCPNDCIQNIGRCLDNNRCYMYDTTPIN